MLGGDVVLEGALGAHRSEGGAVRRKGIGDYVTSVDVASERAIRHHLASGTPHIPMWGEEEGGARADRYWVVDPLDGTTNFVHGFPAVGVSVALIADGAPVVGVIHAPFLGTTWRGARGLGAWRDGERLSVSERTEDEAVVATGFPFRHKQNLPRYLRTMTAALQRFEDLRRPGAASLDLAWVAEGVFDGFFELGLGAWDVAAGALLIEEAGGVVTDWGGGSGYLLGDIIAGPPDVHAALLELAADDEPRGS